MQIQNDSLPDINYGWYRHYKYGDMYFVHEIAWDIDTGKWLVISSHKEPPYSCFATSIDSFKGKVLCEDGVERPKFEFMTVGLGGDTRLCNPTQTTKQTTEEFFGQCWER